MTHENRRLNAGEELARADEALRAATHLAQEKLVPDSISRSYYAMLHAARALLLLEGLEASTHKGLAYLVHHEFVRSGRFPAELGRGLHQAMDFREMADYDARAGFAEADAWDQVQLARDYLAAVRATLAGSWPDLA